MEIKKLVFFCDESCHLTNDNSDYMILAALFCRKDRVKELVQKIREIKEKHNLSKFVELKWRKVSPKTVNMYKEIFDYICSNKKYRFRIIVADKRNITNQNDWYNKMYYHLLNFPLEQILSLYKIKNVELFSDIKDINSYADMKIVCTYLERHFQKKCDLKIISKVSDSKDVTLIQIADILAGAAAYKNRKNNNSYAKYELSTYIEKKFKINFSKTTESKYGEISDYNIFVWRPNYNAKRF